METMEKGLQELRQKRKKAEQWLRVDASLRNIEAMVPEILRRMNEILTNLIDTLRRTVSVLGTTKVEKNQ